jgi:3-methyl-2-oxobutanoate hydroxymethyltransferase
MVIHPTAPKEKAARIRAMKGGARKIASLTAYDYPGARLLDEAGIDIILVGDSLGMVVLGYPDTTHVTMDEMLHHTRACRRGVKAALLLGDLPYMSYDNPMLAVENARRLAGAGADAVKLEGGSSRVREIAAIANAGVPVVGHIGMLPQSVVEEGGYKKKGKTEHEADGLLRDARDVADAGAFAIVLEGIVAAVARDITRSVRIPTIGIGSGPDCDGQVLVLHDVIGAYPWFRPPFAKPRADVAGEITRAAREFIAEVQA